MDEEFEENIRGLEELTIKTFFITQNVPQKIKHNFFL